MKVYHDAKKLPNEGFIELYSCEPGSEVNYWNKGAIYIHSDDFKVFEMIFKNCLHGFHKYKVTKIHQNEIDKILESLIHKIKDLKSDVENLENAMEIKKYMESSLQSKKDFWIIGL